MFHVQQDFVCPECSRGRFQTPNAVYANMFEVTGITGNMLIYGKSWEYHAVNLITFCASLRPVKYKINIKSHQWMHMVDLLI